MKQFKCLTSAWDWLDARCIVAVRSSENCLPRLFVVVKNFASIEFSGVMWPLESIPSAMCTTQANNGASNPSNQG